MNFKKLFESKDNGNVALMTTNPAMMSVAEVAAERQEWSRQEVGAYQMYATGRLNARYANLSDAGKDEHAEGLALEQRTR